MHRRSVLAAVVTGAVGLGGCSFAAGSDGDPTETPGDGNDTTTDEPPTEAPGEPQRPEDGTSVIELETGPRTVSLVPTRFRTDDRASVALWFDRTATPDHPARVRGYLENANDFANTFRIEWIPAVGDTHSRQPRGYDHEARLHLAPTGNNEIATDVPELARAEDGFWHVEDVGPWMATTHRLDPGERVELEYVLVGEPGSPGRPTGTDEFRGSDETVSVHVWDTDSPGPTGESRFDGRSVPGLDSQGTTAWYHEADASTAVYLEPATERVELDARVDFEVVNHSHQSAGCGHWNLHKLVDGEWFHVGPVVHTDDCRRLAPGAREEWALRAFSGEAVDCDDDGLGCRGGFTRGFLGGGEYAVEVGYAHPGDQSAALVELVGDQVEIVPTDGATSERDGDSVTVTTGSHGDGERPPDASITLTRADDADERVIAEQVMASGGLSTSTSGLRDALTAIEPGVERVVVRGDERLVDAALGFDSDVRRFRFRGQAYAVSRDAPGEN